MSLSNILYILLGSLIPFIFYHFYYKKINKELDDIEGRLNDSFIISELKEIQKEINNYSVSIKPNPKIRLRVAKLNVKVINKIEQLEKLR